MGYNIAIDGPAGAGKSTIARRVARELGYIYVDTGAMYRAMAVYFQEQGLTPEDLEHMKEICGGAEIVIRYENESQQVYLNGKNVTGRLREEAVGRFASVGSALPEVRAHLLELQRKLARDYDVVMDGRDNRNEYSPACRCQDLSYSKCQDESGKKIQRTSGSWSGMRS